MPYVGRDAEGRILTVAAEAGANAAESIDTGAPELERFLATIRPEATSDLQRSDLALIRVVEDLVDTLIDKNLIRFTDLPEAARQKLMLRRSLRSSINTLKLLGDADDPHGADLKL